MTLSATVDKKTFSSNKLAYNAGTASTRKQSFCYYQLTSAISSDEAASLE
jgi:hypothetical protein